jgi:histone acetyltransferase (RNA polymerase elongator complex component)
MRIFPVFLPQRGCPFQCIYCDQEQFSAVREEPYEQLSKQIERFCKHYPRQEKQVAFYGGTFTGLSESERDRFHLLVAPYLDETTTLRISTRPDQVDDAALEWCKTHQVRTIELGIQDFCDEVLTASQRGYGRETAYQACLRVKQYGFELGIQLMPGLPGFSTGAFETTRQAVSDISPDFLRLYPLVVLKGTLLWEEWQAGRYQPLTMEKAISICADYFELANQRGIAVIKLGIPPLKPGVEYAGPYHPAFGELVQGELLIRKIAGSYVDQSDILVSTCDISLLTGHAGFNIRKLIKRLESAELKVGADATLPRGEIRYVKQATIEHSKPE